MFEIRVAEDDEIRRAAARAPEAYEEFSAVVEPGAHAEMKASIARTTSLADGGLLLVAVDNDTIIGSVVYCAPGTVEHPLFTAGQAFMRAMSVLPDARGRGVGRALTKACLDRAKQDRAKVFALHTSDEMKSARRLYASIGFEEVAEGPSYFGIRYRIYELMLADG